MYLLDSVHMFQKSLAPCIFFGHVIKITSFSLPSDLYIESLFANVVCIGHYTMLGTANFLHCSLNFAIYIHYSIQLVVSDLRKRQKNAG